MADEPVLQGTETEIRQVGVVVKDLEKTVQFLAALGLGPFTVRKAVHPAAVMRGEKVSYEVEIALSQQGPVQLELIEYKRGKTIQKEFVDERGEGLHHILFKVQDIDVALHRFAQKGVAVLQQDRWVDGGGIAYMDTGRIGGIIVEIVQHPPNYDPRVGARYIE